MLRILISSSILVAVALAWLWLVGKAGLWWLTRHPPQVVGGTDTYFITSSWFFRLAVIVPLVLFSAWFWRRIYSHAA